MTSISSSTNLATLAALRGSHRHTRDARDAGQLADELFSKLDSSGQGFVKKSDLEAAVKLGPDTAKRVSGQDIDALFTRFDADGDGKLTRQEFTDSVKRLADQLSQQLRMMDAQGAAANGFSQDELNSQLQQSGGTDKGANPLDATVRNFEQADSNGDGRLDVAEALNFANSDASDASTSAANDEAKLMQQLVKLLQTYGDQQHERHGQFSALQAVTA